MVRGVALADPAFDPDGGGPPSANARAGSWQVLHATVPSADRRPSKNNFWPRGDFLGGLRIVGRYCGARGGSRDADLMNGLR